VLLIGQFRLIIICRLYSRGWLEFYSALLWWRHQSTWHSRYWCRWLFCAFI